MEELFKVPLLFQHYQKRHTNLSFWDFLTVHYSQNNHLNDIEHEKLPLQKHCPEYCPCYLIFILPTCPNLLNDKIIFFSQDYKSYWFDNYFFLPENYLLKPPLTA